MRNNDLTPEQESLMSAILEELVKVTCFTHSAVNKVFNITYVRSHK